jgi:hypothetical protein
MWASNKGTESTNERTSLVAREEQSRGDGIGSADIRNVANRFRSGHQG